MACFILFLSFNADNSFQKIAQECVDTGEESTQTSADIADRQRLSFEVGSRKTPPQAPNPRGDTAQDYPSSSRCSQSLGYGRQRPNLRERHGAMLAAFDAPVARGTCRLPHFFMSGFADPAA